MLGQAILDRELADHDALRLQMCAAVAVAVLREVEFLTAQAGPMVARRTWNLQNWPATS